MKWKWRGPEHPNRWFNHPALFWSGEPGNLCRYSLRERWFLAFHDPFYVGLWVALIGLVVWVASVVL